MKDFMLILHFIGLTMALGTGFANLVLRITAKSLPENEQTPFLVKTLNLARVGAFGLILLIISGFGMLHPYMKTLGSMPLFHVKLTLVAILTVLIGRMGHLTAKARRENGGPSLKKLAFLGRISFFTAIVIVVLAVLTFH
ncbi:hypothetical protein HOH87_05240 [bacterium]|jgi:uncharacterized membrane protein|nr:hypothetical protein [bacterium]